MRGQRQPRVVAPQCPGPAQRQRRRTCLRDRGTPRHFGPVRAQGIPELEIIPRENVFTYHAWRAKGRQVRKGEHGVKITTYIPVPEKRNDAGELTREAGRRPKLATVFHISQTGAL